MANELMITKEQTAKFVHDAKELEVKAFTMKEIAKCLFEKADSIEKEAKNALKYSKEELDRLEFKREEIQSIRKNVNLNI